MPHRQVVLTIPKRLRAYCLYRRRLLGEIARVAARTITAAIRTLTGEPDRAVLRLFVRLALFDEDQAAGMLIWPHSGFHVHTAIWVPEDDRAFATRLARYCARNPVALERLTYDRAAKAVTYRSDKSGGPTAGTETVDPLEFLARVLVHIPDKGHVTTRYYGWDANRPRGMREKAEPPAGGQPCSSSSSRSTRSRVPPAAARCGSSRSFRALVAAMQGHSTDALTLLATVDIATLDGHHTFHLSESYAMAGDIERAMALAFRAVEPGFYPYTGITRRCPFYAPLREAAGFDLLAAKAAERVAQFDAAFAS